jgi:GT2 family glycosyltransferase
VRPGSIQALLDYQDAHREAAIAGSLLEDPDGTPQHCRFRFPDPINELSVGLKLGLLGRLWPHRMSCPPFASEPHRIDWVSGAAMSVRRDVIERIGLFDEGYFLYFEELDFCRRATKAGFQCWHVPQSHVVHLVGRSTGVTVRDRRPGRVPAYWFASRRRYYRKHHGFCYRLLCNLTHASGHAIDVLRRVVGRRPDTGPPRYLRDFLRQTFLPRAWR